MFAFREKQKNVFQFISVPAKWIRMARQDVLNIYTDNKAYAHVFKNDFGIEKTFMKKMHNQQTIRLTNVSLCNLSLKSPLPILVAGLRINSKLLHLLKISS